jgi:hypothetical protein
VSIGAAESAPMPAADTFDQDWQAAKTGAFDGVGEPATDPPGDAVADQPGQGQPPAAAPTPTAQGQVQPPSPSFAWPEDVRPLIEQLPAEMRTNPKEVIAAARNFLSVRGQLPNLQETWRREHVAPVEQRLTAAERELQTLREERRQALESFVTTDPQSGRIRTAQEQQAIRNQIAAAERDQQAQVQSTQAEQERQQQLTQREQHAQALMAQAAQVSDAGLRILAHNSLPGFITQLAESTGVPASELHQFVKDNDFQGQLDQMQDLRQWGTLVQGLTMHAEARGKQVVAQKQAEAGQGGRYRDVASGGGRGGQAGGNRWDRATPGEFDNAWNRALAGNLV